MRRFFGSGAESMSSKRITFEIAADPPPRLDKAIARDVPEAASLSRTRLVRLLADGKVSVDGVCVLDAKAQVSEGAQIVVEVDAAEDSDIRPETIALDIRYEDDDLIVVNKPAGMVVHPAPGSPSGTLVNALLAHCGDNLSGVGGVKRPGIVHRIDKDTSGLLVVAKSDAAHAGLGAQFEAHSVERVYDALVYGVPDASDPRLRGVRGVSFEAGNVLKVTTQLARHKTDRQKQAVVFSGGRHAVTRARVMDAFGAPAGLARVQCWLETGRTHQIRVHMAHAGHGLVGDPVYGGRRRLGRNTLSDSAVAAVAAFPRQALHAARLGFVHPVQNATMRFDAETPSDLFQLIDLLV